MKKTMIVATALLALLTVAGQAATTTPAAPAGYVYLRDGKLVRIPGPGMVYDPNGKLIRRPFACASSSSGGTSTSGGKGTVSFACDNIYAGYVQLPADYVPQN